jgi:hypothetical protein
MECLRDDWLRLLSRHWFKRNRHGSKQLRLRRSLISAHGWSEATTIGIKQNEFVNPEKGSAVGEPFQGYAVIYVLTQGYRFALTLG